MRRAAALIASTMLLAGCSNAPPEGQVVARVDGEEITRRELLAEYRASDGGDLERPEVRKALVERLIDRKLMARAAHGALVDRDADYQADARRMRDMLLVDHYRARLAGSVALPGEAEIAAHIRAHPYRFGDRQALLVDRLMLGSRPAAGETLDALAERLRREGQAPARDRRLIDTGVEAPDHVARLIAAGDGVTILPGSHGEWQALRVVARRPIAMPMAAQVEAARAELRQERIDAAAARLIARLRAQAQVEVQPGFVER